MGYYPKHLKVRRHKRNMRIICTALLGGAMLYPLFQAEGWRLRWYVVWADGKNSHTFPAKRGAAALWLSVHFMESET